MSFRRTENSHEIWRRYVLKDGALLQGLPSEAVASELAFRDYVTNGVHRGTALSPSVFELSSQQLADIWTFIHNKTELDMDVGAFENFDKAFRTVSSKRGGR